MKRKRTKYPEEEKAEITTSKPQTIVVRSLLGLKRQKYSPEVCDFVIQSFSEGRSQTEVISAMGIAPSTFYRWREEYEDFSEAVEYGKFCSKAWWEEKGRDNIENNKFNTGLYTNQMTNRFGSLTSKSVAQSRSDENINYTHTLDISKLSTEDLLALKALYGKAENAEPRLIQDAEIIGDTEGTGGQETD